MLWRVLGPLEVWADNRWTGISAAKLRALLAVLLADPARVVSTERLVDELWADAPPPGARNLVSQYVLRLRRQIGDPAGLVLMTQAPGYRLAVAAGDLDAARFTELVTEGRRALEAHDVHRAAGLLSRALGLWRGPALADVPPGKLVTAEAGRLEELRLAAEELRIEACLGCGRGAELVSELRRLTAEHPLRERFWHQLMRALQECGRPAEALAAYAQAREIIADELGADPGADLQELHHRLLAGGPLPVPDPAPGAARAVVAVPHQLPGTVRDFVGRAEELRRLSGFGDGPADSAGPVVISAISGTAGVGKTALAVHWAHQVADRFPDGQLYVNLRGYDPSQPMSPADALAGFLRALGWPGTDIPAGTDERAARYRSLLSGRQVLVVLDNAGDVAQVRPLLPGTPGCVTVVTSRSSLGGLVARDGTRRLDLDLLPLADATSLLRALIGERAAADPVATQTLAAQCAQLPLALRLAAELAVAERAVPLADLAAELSDQQRRLDLLAADGDPHTAVRAVFSWSYRHLDSGAARAFRLAGLHPGPDLDRHAAAALTGAPVIRIDEILAQLTRAHLLRPAEPGRYAAHDLLRAYARELAASQDSEQERQAALSRLFDHYLYTAAVAMDALYPDERHRRPHISRPATPALPMTEPAAARAWLDAERATLVTVVFHTATCGWPGHAIRLAEIMFRYLECGGHYPEISVICDAARRAARDTGDRTAEATALNNLCSVDLRQGRYAQAAGHLRQALVLHRASGNLTGEARSLGNLGIADYLCGRYAEATGHQHQALALYRQIGDQAGESRTLNNLGLLELRQGHYEPATGYLWQALVMYRQVGNEAGEAGALANLGLVGLRKGRYAEAADRVRQSLTSCRQVGDPAGEAYALTILAALEQRQGLYPQAGRHYRQAVELCRKNGDPSSEAEARNGLGELLLATGQPGHARTQHAAALELASQIGDQYEQAHAHHGLGRAYHADGDDDQARHHQRQALVLYSELGVPEADQVRAAGSGA